MKMRKASDMDHGWAWAVMLAAFIVQFTMGVMVYSPGVIQIILLDIFDGGILMTTWILGISTCCHSLAGPLAGFLTNLTSCRTTMLIGCSLVFIGYTASAFVTELYQLYITLSILAGLGQALLYSPCIVILGFYFERKMNLAVAIAVTGAGVGMMVGSPFVVHIEQVFGWRGMFLIVAGIGGNCFVWSLICRPNTVEKACVVQRKQPTPTHSTNEKVTDEPKCWEAMYANVKAVCGLPVILYCGSVFLWSITISFVTLHLPNYVAVHGFTIAESALLITSMGICNIVTRILAGVTINARFVDQFVVYTGSFAVMAFITLVFPFLPVTFTLSLIYAGLFGLCTGGAYAVLVPITKALVGLQHLAVTFGIEMMICGVGYMLGPPIAGSLFVLSGSYTSSFVFAGLTCALSSILGVLLMKYGRKSLPEDIEISTAET